MNNRTILCFAIFCIMTIVSCKTHKKVAKKNVEKTTEEKLVIEKLKENIFDYQYLDAKFTAQYNVDGKSTTVKGVIRMKKDSVIWASVSPAFGIEIARLKITPDTLKLLNRLQSQYLAQDFSMLNSMLGTNLDFDILQALLTGNDLNFYDNDCFRLQSGQTIYLLHAAERKKNYRVLTPGDRSRLLEQYITLNAKSFKVEKNIIKDVKSGSNIEAIYQDFMKIGQQSFPSQLIIDFNDKRARSLNINYSRIRTQEKIRFPFSIPGKYTKMNE